MIHASHVRLWLGVAALASLPIQAQTARVTGVRVWSLMDATRVVIEADAEFLFRADRAPNPDRLFFDLMGARPRLGTRGQYVAPVNDHLVKQIRVAETVPGVTRVVFDLESDVVYTASQLSNPDRLIVEVREAGAPAPAREAPAAGNVFVPPASQHSMPPSPELPPGPTIALAPALSEAPLKRTSIKVAPPVRPATKPAAAAIQLPPRTAQAAPTAAKIPRSSEGSLTRALGLKVGRIVLDAGHGGHDTGTIGSGGLMEKDLVLDVAKRLGAIIEKRLGSEVIYTRTDDTFVPLEGRTQMANDHRADLFLSIHANSSPARSSSGVETYYLNLTTSKEALEVAARENASSQKTVYELRDLVQRITLQDKAEESREFASRVQAAMHTFSSRGNSRARNRGVKKAPFVVLIGAQMPSVLAEIGFISNPRDESQMKRQDYRQKLAEALFQGLSQYASTLSHFQVASN